MAAAHEALGVALAAHDVALGAHAAGDDPQLAELRAHRALAGHEHVLPEVRLAAHVVVVAVHRFHVRFERLGDDLARGRDHALHHHFAVRPCELLGPAHRTHVVAEVLGAFLEVRQVLVGQVALVQLRVLLREFDEVRADGVAHATRTRVQHEPHGARFVEAHLDEVVAGTQRSQVLVVVRVPDARVVLADQLELVHQLRPGGVGFVGRGFPRTLVAAHALGVASVRHGLLDRRTQRAQVVGQVACVERGLAGHHSAADVHADGGGDDGLEGRDHRAHGRTDAVVHVGHGRDVLEHDGQARGVLELLLRLVFHGHAVRPHLHGDAVGDFMQFVVRHFSFLSISVYSSHSLVDTAGFEPASIRRPWCLSPMAQSTIGNARQ
ncbi:hypothetical protein D3C85_635450 [compost metagenome]